MVTEKTVYIVSGYMRSGTSMMMKSLESGGMEACYNRAKDKTLNDAYERDDYAPNPDGFYELGRKEFDHPDFPNVYAGKLIKVLHWRLKGLPEFNYKVIFMLRDPKEIEVSYLKMFQRRPPFVLQKYHELMEKTIEKLTARKGFHVLPVQHRDMIKSPKSTLLHIKSHGWPVNDVENAASAVDTKLHRSHGDDLQKVRETIPGLRTDLPDILIQK